MVFGMVCGVNFKNWFVCFFVEYCENFLSWCSCLVIGFYDMVCLCVYGFFISEVMKFLGVDMCFWWL